jgi:TrmH family RNA methyltransferase
MLEAPLITSQHNPRVKELRAAFAGNARDGRVAVEGGHLVAEALRSGVRKGTLFLHEKATLPMAPPPGITVARLSKPIFDRAVATEAPQGIALLFTPNAAAPRLGTKLILIAAGLQDPGNMGTLVRSADAFGATGCVTTSDTVNPWNQKAIRSSAGSIFRMPLVLGQKPGDLTLLKQNGIRIFAAVKAGGTPFTEADFTQPCAVMVGNEGAGLSPAMMALADELVTIPCPGAVESLNAAIAGSLLLYEASRQRALHPAMHAGIATDVGAPGLASETWVQISDSLPQSQPEPKLQPEPAVAHQT